MTIDSLWICIGIGIIVSTTVFLKITKRKRIALAIIWNHHLILLIAALIGSRILFLFFNFENYPPILDDWKNIRYFFYIWDKGLNLWGGIIGFASIFIFYAIKQEENLKKWVDVFIIPFFILMLFSNVGDLLEGTNYGKNTDLPWGITFASNINVKYTVPVHPSQIYAFLYTLLIILFPYRQLKRKNFFKEDGNLSIFLIGIFSFLNFIFGFLLGDDAIYVLFLRLEQIFAFIITALCGGYLFYSYKKFIKSPNFPVEEKSNTNSKNEEGNIK